MKPTNIKSFFLTGQFLFSRKLAIGLWFGLSFFAVVYEVLLKPKINNYQIFKYSFLHIQQHLNLYLQYPQQHEDVFLYGPSFTVLIAPFALLPNWLGCILWVLFNTAILFFAINKLPLKQAYKNAILILCSHEMMNASSWLQYNAVIAACIILGFVYIIKGKEFWALLFIVFASVTKVYGLAAFSFFFFSKNKIKFIGYTLFWMAVIFVLPVLVTSFSFIIESYKNWGEALLYKANKNVHGALIDYNFQDISVMGMIRRIFNAPNFKDVYVLPFALIAFLSQYVQWKHFKDLRYQLYFLCSALLFVIIFSNGAESPTYLIAFPASCIWFVIQPPGKKVNAFFVFCLLLTSFSYSDIFTPYTRAFCMKYSLKALPSFILWIVIVYQILTKQFLKIDVENGLKLRTLSS